MKIQECSFPKESLLMSEAASAGFADSFVLAPAEKDLYLLEIYRLMVNNTPLWINTLLTLRNKIVKILGLTDVGKLGGIEKMPQENDKDIVGTKLDIFTIEYLSKNEMILMQNDKHLDIKLSILKCEDNNQASIIVSTIVNFHNSFGKMYMFIIKPFHKMIVKRLLSNISLSK